MIWPWRFRERSRRPSVIAGGFRPEVDGQFDPGRHRNGSHPAVFAAEVDDHPAAVALLDVRRA